MSADAWRNLGALCALIAVATLALCFAASFIW